MSRIGASAAFALLFSMSGGALAATAHVTFVNPESIADLAAYGDEREAAATEAALSSCLERLAATKLPADQTLEIEILDLRLAGQRQSWWNAMQTPPLQISRAGRLPFGDDVRVTQLASWPSVKLRYRLKQGDQVLASGEDAVSDLKYLDRAGFYSSDDPLRFEKQMLRDWFQRRLVQPRSGR
jgi:hypothetical protein